jgi:hypothetical protein
LSALDMTSGSMRTQSIPPSTSPKGRDPSPKPLPSSLPWPSPEVGCVWTATSSPPVWSPPGMSG